MAKRISELEIATSVSDSDYIPCVQSGVTKRATRAALYPDDVPVDTSSRIIDLTGDRAPAIPDDPAGVTYQNIQNFTSADGWSTNNCTLSYSGGKMVVTATGSNPLIFRTVTASRLVIMKVRKVSGGTTESRINNTTGTSYLRVKSYGNNTEHYHSLYIGAGATGNINLYPGLTGSASGDIYEISEIYIGTGAYLSKLVDRANVPWTNYGALPVDGPFGKGLQFNGAQYLQAPGPMIGTTGTVACRFKRGTIGTPQVLFSNANAGAISGIACFFSVADTLIIRLRTGSAAEDLLSVTISDTTYTHDFSFTINGVNAQVTFDGTKYSKTLSAPISIANLNNMFVGSSLGTNEFFTGTIYALRADARVWTDEEIARWSRDPYSEDSGLVDAFSLDFSNLPTFADNAAAIAGKLPAGKLYRTSTGNVLVRY